MSEPERFSISQLAAAAATTPRTVRFYTAEGLLPPPPLEGRVAVYTDVHRRRLRLIQRLKAAYLPLSAIKEQMAGLTEGEVDTLLERSGRHRVENTGPPHGKPERTGAALVERPNVTYVAQILAAVQTPYSESTPSSTTEEATFERPEETPPNKGSRPSIVSPERWERISLAPGIELHAREPLTQARRADVAKNNISEPNL